ncbi:hypothetical protein FQA47_016875 [Oryzias melastigma]|uniref:Uncharacterized protein n=1 Tax=Oryzias melastigma TaxID=30732 RepID=A0A834F0E2_ORYME|nr:hypothetical protein FQA47_016875 [Oryzias melastigma]
MATLASPSLSAPPPLACLASTLISHTQNRARSRDSADVGLEASRQAEERVLNNPPALAVGNWEPVSCSQPSFSGHPLVLPPPHPPGVFFLLPPALPLIIVLLLPFYSRLLRVLVLLTLFRGTLCDGLLSCLLVATK